LSDLFVFKPVPLLDFEYQVSVEVTSRPMLLVNQD
jgi:hypothetical protein